jgi:hypothetical protein
VKEATFWTSPSKDRSRSRTHQDPSYDNNDYSYHDSGGIGGKVL